MPSSVGSELGLDYDSLSQARPATTTAAARDDSGRDERPTRAHGARRRKSRAVDKSITYERLLDKADQFEPDDPAIESEICAVSARPSGRLDWRHHYKSKTDVTSFLQRIPAQAHIRAPHATEIHDSNGRQMHKRQCDECARDLGPWATCRVLRTSQDYFEGACTNCAWQGHKGRCSFYTGSLDSTGRRPVRSVDQPGQTIYRTSQTVSSLPHTMYNKGYNTLSTRDLTLANAQLERDIASKQAEIKQMELQIQSNSARMTKLQAGRRVREWSNDSTETAHSSSSRTPSQTPPGHQQQQRLQSASAGMSTGKEANKATEAGEAESSGGSGSSSSGGSEEHRPVRKRRKA